MATIKEETHGNREKTTAGSTAATAPAGSTGSGCTGYWPGTAAEVHPDTGKVQSRQDTDREPHYCIGKLVEAA